MKVADIEEAVRVAVGMLAVLLRSAEEVSAPPDTRYPSTDRAMAFANRHRGAAKRMAHEIDALIAKAAIA
jgi:hypothetical protein